MLGIGALVTVSTFFIVLSLIGIGVAAYSLITEKHSFKEYLATLLAVLGWLLVLIANTYAVLSF